MKSMCPPLGYQTVYLSHMMHLGTLCTMFAVDQQVLR